MLLLRNMFGYNVTIYIMGPTTLTYVEFRCLVEASPVLLSRGSLAFGHWSMSFSSR